MTNAVLAPVRDRFRALACTIVPDASTLDEPSWIELESIVERRIASRPDAMKRQLRMLVRLLDVLPLVRWGRTFRALDAARRTRFLLAIQDAPLLLLRRGFWGLRTLVFMGYYGRPEAAAAIGYRASVATVIPSDARDLGGRGTTARATRPDPSLTLLMTRRAGGPSPACGRGCREAAGEGVPGSRWGRPHPAFGHLLPHAGEGPPTRVIALNGGAARRSLLGMTKVRA